MARRGGESDKLGNRYEGVWTVENLLDVLSGQANSLTVEPLGRDALGIEFIKETSDGEKEFHSVKRQTTGATWTISQLISGGKESILGHLFDKLETHPKSRVIFVSATTANELNELTEQAARLKTFECFMPLLQEAQWRQKEFDALLSLCGGKPETAFDYLKRTEVVGETERRLIQEVEQRIRADICKIDNSEIDPAAVRLLLADIVFDWFQRPLTKTELLKYLAAHDLRERDLLHDKSVLALIARRNRSYAARVEAELIQAQMIEREEAKQAYEVLTDDNTISRVAIIGGAGLGKSCTVAQTLHLLERSGIPVIAIRLDVQIQALTSDILGKQLGFPVSPAIVLSRIAAAKRCVLLIDQLDSLSFASGRNQHLWDAFEELLCETESFHNMRVLLACRAFDLENDVRLRRIIADQKLSVRIDLKLLDVALVKETLSKATGKPCELSENQLQLLQIPVNLNLYLQVDTNPSFRNVQDLLARFWEHKRKLVSDQLGHEPRWKEVIATLTNWLSDHQTLSAPTDILDAWDKDARVMASQCVLTIDEGSCRFFHELFFDYAFARSFVANDGKICDLLLSQEQHLFRRAQVRQILTYQRERDFAAYLSELKNLLSHKEIRFHVKKLVLDWLRGLENPTVEEWAVLEELNPDLNLSKFVRLVPHNSVPWFEVLLRSGTWDRWIDSADQNLRGHAFWLLGMPNIMRAESKKVAVLLSPRLDNSDPCRNQFMQVAIRGELFYSPEMFGLFLEKLRVGWFDKTPQYWWHQFDELPKFSPSLATDLVVSILERLRQQFNGGGSIEVNQFSLSTEFITSLEQQSPEEFPCRILPVAIALIYACEFLHEDGELDDRLVVYHLVHDEHSFKDAFFGALERSLQKLSMAKPNLFEELIAPYESRRYRTVAILLLKGWAANGQRFADKAIRYILAEPSRFELGFSMWNPEGGDGRCAITRAVLRETASHGSEENYRQLEATILKFHSSAEKGNIAHRGFYQMLLLEALPQQRMSSGAKLQLERLLRKFGKMNFSAPRSTGVITIGSPIPKEAAKKMTDGHWISAMRKYSPARPRTPENWGKGGGHELASLLRTEAQSNKARFAQMALQLPADIPWYYFEAILDGIAETFGDLPKETQADANAPQPLDTNIIVAVIRCVHNLPNHPCGRTICSAIRRIAERELPKEVFEIVTYYAVNDLNPHEETWMVRTAGGQPYYGGDPYSAGINSVRGGAASAIAQLLFRDIARWPYLELAVRSLTVDKSLAVRSVALDCLLALMNRDRDLSIELFLKLVEGADAVLGSHSSDNYLHHAIYSNYSDVRMILIAMLKSTHEKARATAARQITIAAFHNKEAMDDAQQGMIGDEHCRDAVAGVFAYNLGNEPVRARCRDRIIPFFNDDSEKVRKTADNCFRQLSSEQLADEQALIFAFIESRAFDDGFEQLVYALKESTALLPDVICAIPEKVVAKHVQETPTESIEQRRPVFGLSELVVRLYEQTRDSRVKKRCLDVIDSLLELGMGTLEGELNKIER
jgi:hypothetical protein